MWNGHSYQEVGYVSPDIFDSFQIFGDFFSLIVVYGPNSIIELVKMSRT